MKSLIAPTRKRIMSDTGRLLSAMGIDVWRLRSSDEEDTQPEPMIEPVDEMPVPLAVPLVKQVAQPESEEVSVSIAPSKTVETEPQSVAADSFSVADLDWEALQSRVAVCERCDLCKGREQTVFGVGDRKTNFMVVGEAPGAEEDKMGEPFVGRAGQLLNQMLRALGYGRDQVYIANVIKCRPPNNRDPSMEEMALCQAYLKRQIDLIQPKVILAVGRIAAQTLLKSQDRVGIMRGKVHQDTDYGVPTVVTYHPAYLLRSPHEKAKSWQDLRLAKSVIDR